MALSSTPVAVADDGTETLPAGSAATALYTLLKARAQTQTAVFGQPFPTGSEAAPILQGIAATANDFASWLVTELTTNAKAKIPNTADGDGLQTSQAAGNPTTRPASDKFLSIV